MGIFPSFPFTSLLGNNSSFHSTNYFLFFAYDITAVIFPFHSINYFLFFAYDTPPRMEKRSLWVGKPRKLGSQGAIHGPKFFGVLKDCVKSFIVFFVLLSGACFICTLLFTLFIGLDYVISFIRKISWDYFWSGVYTKWMFFSSEWIPSRRGECSPVFPSF